MLAILDAFKSLPDSDQSILRLCLCCGLASVVLAFSGALWATGERRRGRR